MKHNDSVVPLTIAQQEQVKRYGDANQYAAMYRYIADEMKAGRIAVAGGTSSSRYYWFDQAARINAGDTQSPASFFIRAATRYGLAANGKSTTAADIQKISNNIGAKVYKDIKDNKVLPPFSQQLNADISSATNEGGMTLGGWGGAFYFWKERYVDPDTGKQTTVGEYIRSNPAELKKFISVNSRAIADTVSQFGTKLSTDPAFSDALLAGIKNFNHSPESQAVGTHLLAATTLELKRRGLENLAQAFNDITEKLKPSLSSVIDLSDTTVNNLITDLQTLFAQAEVTISPLIIDLDGGGIQTLGLNAGIHFDHDHNGFAQLSGWAGKGEALVVRDLNGDGKIDSGLELFGNHTTLKNGTKAANGFIALAEFDTNNDGQIDANEANSAKIQLWRDANTNGIVDAGELLNFAQGGIKSLGTRYTEQNTSDAQGNQHRQIGSVIKTNGSTLAMHDVWFKQDTARTVEKNWIAINSAIATLPNIRGFGNVHSLHQAMAREKTGTLQTLVKKLVTSTPYHERQSLFEQIIFHWTGANQYSKQSRGQYISDGRKLYVLEAFLGKTFIQSSGTNEGLPDPGPEAAQVIERAYAQLSQTINQQLTAQTFYKPLYDGLTLRWNKQAQSLEINADGLIQYLQKQYAIAPVNTQILLYDFAATLHTQGGFGKNILDVIKLKGNPDGQGLQRDLAFISHRAIYGTQKNDTLAGIHDRNNLISGDSGDDTLTAGNKNDILIGGQGNDTLQLGAGQNTVIYNLGDGKDTIHTVNSDYKPNRTNNDILKLGAGITAASTRLVRGLDYNSSDLTLVFQDGGQVKLKNYFSRYHNLATIEFADGTSWSRQTVVQKLIYRGTDGDDTLNSSEATETLIAGKGNDTLHLGAGQNTVIYNLGDGKDTIHTVNSDYKPNRTNNDILKLGAGITPATTRLVRGLGYNSNDLTLVFQDGGQVKLKDYFSRYHNLGTIQFADGTSWGRQTVVQKLIYRGTDGDDTLNSSEATETLIAGKGNDTLYLGAGQNTVIYNLGDGKDTIHTVNSDYKPNRTNNDILKLGTGITTATTQLVRGQGYNSNDLTLAFQDGGQVKLKDYFSRYHNLATIQFADGTQWHTETVTNRLNTQNPAKHARMVSQAGQVDQLIHAMAAFAPPVAGETSVLPDHRVTTTLVLAVS